MTMPMSKETIVQLLATDDLYRVTVAEHLLANRPSDVAARELDAFADDIAHEAAEFAPGTDLTATIIRRAREKARRIREADHA